MIGGGHTLQSIVRAAPQNGGCCQEAATSFCGICAHNHKDKDTAWNRHAVRRCCSEYHRDAVAGQKHHPSMPKERETSSRGRWESSPGPFAGNPCRRTTRQNPHGPRSRQKSKNNRVCASLQSTSTSSKSKNLRHLTLCEPAQSKRTSTSSKSKNLR